MERSAGSGSHAARLSPALRREDGVRPLELFFDLVFVLAIGVGASGELDFGLLVAGIVLVALGIEASIAHYDEHLHAETAFALFGGTAVYLVGLVSFRYRQVRTLNLRRLALAAVLLALIPVAVELPALASRALVVVGVWALIALDHRSYGAGRARFRHEVYGPRADSA